MTNGTKCPYCGVLFDANAAPAPPAELPPAFTAAMQKDDLIEAIKLWRQTYGVGLKEARDAVLELKKRH
jgi:ribosomal protein L7/L12